MAFPSDMENSPNAVEDHSNLIGKDDDKEFRDVLNELREEIRDEAANTATMTEAPQTLEDSTKSSDQAKEEEESKEEELPMTKSEQIMTAMMALPMLRLTEMMVRDLANNPQATKCGCSTQHLILPPPIRSILGSSSPSCGGCMQSSCTDCKRTVMPSPIMMPPPAAMIIRMMSTPHSSIYPPPSFRERSYEVPAYPKPSYPYPAPAYAAPTYTVPAYPKPGLPMPSYPAPAYPAPKYA